MLNCDYLFLSRDYLFTLIKMSKYFILSYYYHICLPQLIWNSSARRKRAPGRRVIVCTQAGPNWVAVGPVSTPLLRIFWHSTAWGKPAQFNQKRPTTGSNDCWLFHVNSAHQWIPCIVHETHKPHFSATFSLTMGLTVLFTHLKIILLQCFQFSIFNF